MPSTTTSRLEGLTTSVAVKAPCRVATTANITLSGVQTVDGILLEAGDRVLVKNQTATADNGIWVVGENTWQRASDFNGSLDVVQGTIVGIGPGGTTTGATWWQVTTANPITIGSTAMTFAQLLLGAQLITGGGVVAANRTVLSQLPTASVAVYLAEAGREGTFKWSGADLSAYVTKDTEQGIYVAPSSDTDGSSGAWVRQYDGPWNIRWFGATGVGNSHDDRPALVGALNLMQVAPGFGHATHGSTRSIYFPSSPSYYYISATVEIAKPVVLMGDGADPNGAEYGTTIKCPATVTPFYFTRKTGIGTADGWSIRDMSIEALASNSNTGLASNTYSSKTVTLAAAGDFANGQLVFIRGSGLECNYCNASYWFAATTSGSPTITVTFPANVTEIALAVGMHLQVRRRDTDAAAFPMGSRILSIVGNLITMSANATATVAASNGKLTYFEDRVFVIDSGGGTTTLVMNDFPTNTNGFSGHVIEHYDSAIYCESRGLLEGAVSTSGFAKGAGWVIHANATITNRFGQSPNANQCRQTGFWWTYSNRNGHRAQGNDANQCSFLGFDGYQNSEYQYVDASFLGNQVHASHSSSNLGYMTCNINARSTIVAGYTEGGTNNTFAPCTAVFGGFMGSHEGTIFGGVYFGANNSAASLPPSHLYPPDACTLNVLQGSNDLASGIWSIDNSGRGGTATLQYMKYSTVAADGVAGVFGVYDNNAARWGWGFTDSGHARGTGLTVAAQGLLIGSGGDMTNPMRKVIYGTAAPLSGTWVAGDQVLNSAPAVGQPKGWYCTVGGAPGTWVADSNL